MDDEDATRTQRRADSRQKLARPAEKREYPANPRAVGAYVRQLVEIEIQLARDDVRERGVTRSGPDVEQRLPDREARAPPGIECARAPHAVLQTGTRVCVR